VRFDTPHVRTPKRYDFCDVLVVGGGPSGLSAALAAGRAGAKVVLVDEHARVGGSLVWQRGGSAEPLERLRVLEAQLRALPNVSLRPATTAAGWYTDHWVPLVDATRMTKMRARAVVVAGGAFEQPAVFRHNDLPGVMLASAAQRLLWRHAVRPMRTAVVLAGNADGYRAALDLLQHGVTVAALVDLRAAGEPSALGEQVKRVGIAVLKGHCVHEAEALDDRLAGVVVCPLGADGSPQTASPQKFACDGLITSVGWAPAAALLYQSGARMRYDATLEQFRPDTLPDGMFAAGRVNGVYALDAKLEDGARAGDAAARHVGCSVPAREYAIPAETMAPSHPWPIVEHPAGKNFVDFDEDLQVKDFFNAAQEGFDNIELLKRYSTVGMGPSQGKHSNMNAIRLLARIRGATPGEVGTTTSRPFFHPVPLSHLAGRGFHPERHTPLRARHDALGAVWMPAGNWQRPDHYAQPGLRKAEAVAAEVRAVRTAVGLIDVGTLGKIELHGVDAGEFLERVYTGRFANLKVGMTRYGVMLDEAGVVIDDGVIARLAQTHFYFTTTTTGSASVYRELQRLLAMWRLDVGIVNATGAHAAMNLAGPKSRVVLRALTDLDLSSDAFPYLAVRDGRVAGVPARLMRVGFVGEAGYEIHVAAEHAGHVWDALSDAGAAHGLRPFGVEAQRVLRLEKGHIIVGQDTDGLTAPDEANLEWAVKMDKPFFVGQRSVQGLRVRGARHRLVGFALDAAATPGSVKECHLVIRDGAIAGRVTSVTASEAVGRTIGLAYVPTDMTAPGTRFFVRGEGGAMVQAEVVPTPFHDPAGDRQKVFE
jgi:sarcosine oxidase subunit alpha